MYKFIITKDFSDNQEEYLWKIDKNKLNKYLKVKKIFIKNPFDSNLSTHKILNKWNFIIYSSYLNKKDRIIFIQKKPNEIIPYKIIDDHDYNKLLKVLKFIFPEIINKLK